MSEAQTIDVTSASHLRNMARVKRDEEELEALKRQARGETDEDQTDDTQSEPSSEDTEGAAVQDASVSEQEAKEQVKTEAPQEDDEGDASTAP